MPTKTECPECGSDEVIKVAGLWQCEECGERFEEDDVLCRYCDGTGEGQVDGSRCRSCSGSGIAASEVPDWEDDRRDYEREEWR